MPKNFESTFSPVPILPKNLAHTARRKSLMESPHLTHAKATAANAITMSPIGLASNAIFIAVTAGTTVPYRSLCRARRVRRRVRRRGR